jgi:hypothetical protein
MGETCNTHARDEKGIQNLEGKSEEKDELGDVILDGRIILKLMLRKYFLRVSLGFGQTGSSNT